MPLTDESKLFLIINTCRGLYQYTWLPCGVASAPALFQKATDGIFQGLSSVICYYDDILVTRALDWEPLKNFKEIYTCQIELCSLLGFLNYYGKLLCNVVSLLH